VDLCHICPKKALGIVEQRIEEERGKGRNAFRFGEKENLEKKKRVTISIGERGERSGALLPQGKKLIGKSPPSYGSMSTETTGKSREPFATLPKKEKGKKKLL